MKRSNARGYTLIELVVIIGIASVVLGLISVSFQTLFRTGRQLRGRMAADDAFARLYIQFVTDVHAARSARVGTAQAGHARAADGAATELVLDTGRDQTIVYQVADHGGVLRSVRHAGRRIAHDRYRLPAAWRIRFAPASASTGETVSLRIRPRATETPDAPTAPAWHADAVLGTCLPLAVRKGTQPRMRKEVDVGRQVMERSGVEKPRMKADQRG